MSHEDVISSTTKDSDPPPLLHSNEDARGSLGAEGNVFPVKPVFLVGDGLRVMARTSLDQHAGQQATGYDLESKDKASQ